MDGSEGATTAVAPSCPTRRPAGPHAGPDALRAAQQQCCCAALSQVRPDLTTIA